MIWKDELKLIEELFKRLENLGTNIGSKVTQVQSRVDTLHNELVRLEADYQVILSRNETAKREYQKSIALDTEQLAEGKRRVQQRELQLIEKEKMLKKLQAELETEIASAKASKNTIDAIGRTYVKK